MQLPINIRRTRQCPRCGLDYPVNAPACIHCSNLTDRQVEELRQRYAEEGRSEKNLGMLFIYIAILIIIGMLIYVLTR